jgi:hypothetical protein
MVFFGLNNKKRKEEWYKKMSESPVPIPPSSIADPGCLSRTPDPGFFTHPRSRIPDLESWIQKPQQKRGDKKFAVIPFFVATNFTKLKIIIFLKC